MAKKKRFVFLSDEFYGAYPASEFPEIEQKRYRPYIQVIIEIGELKFAIPLRSGINHPHVFWTDKENHCGVDFSKAVVINDDCYIDSENEPRLRQNEFDALRGKDYRIKVKMSAYIEKYKKARKNINDPINHTLVKFSTLQYFENEIGFEEESPKDDVQDANSL